MMTVFEGASWADHFDIGLAIGIVLGIALYVLFKVLMERFLQMIAALRRLFPFFARRRRRRRRLTFSFHPTRRQS